MQPESTSVTYRPDLAAFVPEYDMDAAVARLIGQFAAPMIPSAEEAGQYYVWNREAIKKRYETARAPDGRYNRVMSTFGSGNFTCQENGLEEPIDDRRAKKYGDLFNAEQAVTRKLRHLILREHEHRVAAMYAGASLTANTAATAWSSGSSAVPLSDLDTGIKTLQDNCGCGSGSITWIVPRADFREFLLTDQVNDKLKYTYRGGESGVQPSMITPEMVADMLGIRRVLVAESSYDSAGDGLTESMSQIWTAGTTYLAVLAEPGDTNWEAMSAFRTVYWTEENADAGLPVVETYYEPATRGEIVRVRHDTDEIATAEADLMVYELSSDA